MSSYFERRFCSKPDTDCNYCDMQLSSVEEDAKAVERWTRDRKQDETKINSNVQQQLFEGKLCGYQILVIYGATNSEHNSRILRQDPSPLNI
eukprot:scaffold25250_cov122-Cylindrotheca_fusiformis.AAC.1